MISLRVHRSVAKDKITARSADGLDIGKTPIPVGRMYKLAVEKGIGGDSCCPPPPPHIFRPPAKKANRKFAHPAGEVIFAS